MFYKHASSSWNLSLRTANIIQLLTGDEGNIWYVGPEDKMPFGLGQHFFAELEIKGTTESTTSASYLDLLLWIGRDGQLHTSIYDKRDDFNFHITNFPFLSSNIPSSPAYGVFISQLIRYARTCSSYECFIMRARRLSSKLLKQGYLVERLKSSFRKFYGRYGDLIQQYEVSLSRMLNDILILDQQWLPNQSDFPPISWPWYRALPSPIMSGFHGAFATGVACQQGTLTPPDTWFRPLFGELACALIVETSFPTLHRLMTIPNLTFIELREVSMEHLRWMWHASRERLPFRTPVSVSPLWDLLVLQLFSSDSSNLPCLYSTFHLEYPLVLSWFCFLKVQHMICCPNPQSIIVLLYLHWLRIKYSIQTIHKQTDHDQTGLKLEELIWDELALVWINSYTITPVHVIQVANNKLTQLGTKWFRTKWIQNESTCMWRQTRHSGPTSVLYAIIRSNIDFYSPAASNINNRDYIERNLYGYITKSFIKPWIRVNNLSDRWPSSDVFVTSG